MVYIREALRVLKPGGEFVCLVPSFASIASRIQHNEDIPRHLYFFTRRTIRSYARGS
jgi:hypothetical protein